MGLQTEYSVKSNLRESSNVEAFCSRHPAKRIEFFWDVPNLGSSGSEFLFCSTCILKGCLPCSVQELQEIEDFLLLQKGVLESKGLSEMPEITKKLAQQKVKKETSSQKSSTLDIKKIFDTIASLEERVIISFSNLRKSIEAELQSRNNEFTISLNSLQSSIFEAYTPSILANYANFDQVLDSFQASTPNGLAGLLSVLASVTIFISSFQKQFSISEMDCCALLQFQNLHLLSE